MAVAARVPAAIASFLAVATPDAWCETAVERLPELLNDHANCELKAASTALGLLYRYPHNENLAQRLSRLAREELRHFEQVRNLMQECGIAFERLSASRYASALRKKVRGQEPYRLIDTLLVAALIEARSCERFATLAPRLPLRIGQFYAGLLASEARHFEHYLAFACDVPGVDAAGVAARLTDFKQLECELITSPDTAFRFHSGCPVIS